MAALKTWVIFHTFVLNSQVTARRFESPDDDSMTQMGQPLASRVDYDNITTKVYEFRAIGDVGKRSRSYTQLYELYMGQSKENIGMVKNFLNDFGVRTGYFRPDKLISDSSYWQIMVYYSVIEKIVGRQPFCSVQHECEKCGKSNITHNPLSEVDWIHKRLLELVKDEQTVSSYESVILAVRQKIRHSTVHSSIVPTAERDFAAMSPGLTVYDLKRSIGNYDKDHHALDSLIHMLSDVARNLLLERLFNLDLFIEPQPLNVLTMGAPGVAMSANPDHYK